MDPSFDGVVEARTVEIERFPVISAVGRRVPKWDASHDGGESLRELGGPTRRDAAAAMLAEETLQLGARGRGARFVVDGGVWAQNEIALDCAQLGEQPVALVRVLHAGGMRDDHREPEGVRAVGVQEDLAHAESVAGP